jgi:hypothetical protein
MAEKKYGRFVKTNFLQGTMVKTQGKAKPGYVAWPMGTDLEGLNINFSWGVHSQAGDNFPDKRGFHIHPFDELLLFTGLDYNSPNALSAEIEMTLGEERQKYIFDEPTIILVPRGMPHNHPVTRKVDKTYGFIVISLDAQHKTTFVEEKSGPPRPDQIQHGQLVKKMFLRDMKRKSGGNADFIAGFGGKTLEGFKLNFTWAFHTGLGDWHPGRDPHVHPYDEILVFVGLNPANPGYLGAEIEIGMGEEIEKFIFDQPTVVVVPGGLVHCPLTTRRVDKPYGFSAICLNGEHETTWLGPDKSPMVVN